MALMRTISLATLGGAALAIPASALWSQAAPAPAPAKALYSPDGDAYFAQPYVDVDEWRDAPVRHRYVHGGFKGTDTRFSFYFPAKDQYKGHFFQYITPVPDNENLAQGQGDFAGDNPVGFSVASGAYFIETNGGGKFDLGSMDFMKRDPTIAAYRANAASAAYSRVIAMQMYGGKRPYGYAYGGSGGAYRTIGSFENTRGVWDGVVPFVMGSNMAIPNMFTVRMRAMRIIGDKFPQIVDAASPGGSGDIYAGLTPIQADALREVTRMGFPPQSWFGWKTMGIHGFAALYQGVVMADPTYFTDFWTKPGYLGFDHPEQFVGARLQFPSTVAGVLTAADAARAHINIDASNERGRGQVDTAFRIPEGAEGQRIAAFKLAAAPPPIDDFLGGDLIVTSGAATGKRLPLAHIVGDVAVLGIADARVAAMLKPGDQVEVDNSNFLAIETYHRHQVPDASYKVWDQFRKSDGTPIYPQHRLIGPGFVKATAGSIETGKWSGKMIVVESLWDREAMPWQADWYRGQVRAHLGAQTDANFRLWFTDHALHGGVEDPSRTISYVPVLQQALRDISAWVEHGTSPPASTTYRVDDGQVIVPATAAARGGIQPVVTLTAGGRTRVVIKRGQSVAFTGTITAPPRAGTIVGAAWDFDGAGKFPVDATVAKGKASVSVTTTHRFDRPGTFFPALRGVSQRQGDARTPFARLQNLGRMRVVVK